MYISNVIYKGNTKGFVSRISNQAFNCKTNRSIIVVFFVIKKNNVALNF